MPTGPTHAHSPSARARNPTRTDHDGKMKNETAAAPTTHQYTNITLTTTLLLNALKLSSILQIVPHAGQTAQRARKNGS
jgi:hypothetical protein